MSTASLLYVCGAVVGLLGLVMLLRALFHDRARGRRRCPRCWYDMSSIPGLTCPECGRAAQSERRLWRTRRRYRMAALWATVLLLAAGTLATPGVLRRGPIEASPTWLLITVGWVYDTDDYEILTAVELRLDSSELLRARSSVERWMLARRCGWELAQAPPATASMSSNFLMGSHSPEMDDRRFTALVMLLALGADAEPAIPLLMTGLQVSTDPAPPRDCAFALGMIARRPDTVLPALAQTLTASGNRPLQAAGARAMGQFGSAAAPFVPNLIALAEAPGSLGAPREAVATALGRIAARPDLCVPVLARMLAARTPGIRNLAAEALGRFGSAAEPAVPALAAAVRDSLVDPSFGLDALAAIGEPALPALLGFVTSPNPEIRRRILGSIAKLAGAHRHREATDAVLTAARTERDPRVREHAILACWYIARADPRVPEFLHEIIRNDPDAAVRGLAVGVLRACPPDVGPLLTGCALALGDPDPAVRRQAARVLTSVGPAATPLIPELRALADADPAEEVRSAARQTIEAATAERAPPPR